MTPPAGSVRVEKRRRYHEALLAAFATGMSLRKAARAVGVSERTAQRWRAKHESEVQAAKENAVAGLFDQVRKALPVGLARLRHAARRSKDESTAVRASVAIWDLYVKATARMEQDAEIAELRRQVEELHATHRGGRNGPLAAGNVHELPRRA